MVNFNAGDPNDSEDDVQSQDGDTGIPFHHASTAASVQGPEPGDNAYEAMEGPHFDDHAADSDSDDDTPDHEESGSDDEEDDDDDGLASGRTPGPCCVAVRNNLRQEHNTAIQVLRTSHQQRETVLNDHLAERNRRIAELETRIGELNTEVAELNAQVLARKRGGHSHTTRKWPELLNDFLDLVPGAKPYSQVYAISCMEGNMSPKLRNIHPNLRFREMTNKERRNILLSGIRRSSESVHDERMSRIAKELIRGLIDQALGVKGSLFMDNTDPITAHLPQLPNNVWAIVLKHVFNFQGKMVHCISRLDPHEPPEAQIIVPERESGFLKRFHIGSKSCSVTAALTPKTLLAPFLVSKLWYFLGAHSFYGQNTFAFSSLGEFGRFCRGIGHARRSRIQSVELLWIGSQYLGLPFDHKNKHKSLRTWSVHWLMKMPRLKRLVIHIPESSPMYARRRHEPEKTHGFMLKATAGQPNFHPNRALRTVQGMDFVYQLRGLKSILIYDFSKHLSEGRGRHPIRDWTFYEDVSKNVYAKKRADKAEAAKLQNLEPLINPCPDGFVDLIRSIYDNERDAAYDVGDKIERDLLTDSDDEDQSEDDTESDRSDEDSSSDGGSSDDGSSDDGSSDGGAGIDIGRLRISSGTSREESIVIFDEEDSDGEDSDSEDDGSDSDDGDTVVMDYTPESSPIIDLTSDSDDETEQLRRRGQDRMTPIEIDSDDEVEIVDIKPIPPSARRSSPQTPQTHNRNSSESSDGLFVTDESFEEIRRRSTSSRTATAALPSDLQTIPEDNADDDESMRILQARRSQPNALRPAFVAKKRKSPDEDEGPFSGPRKKL